MDETKRSTLNTIFKDITNLESLIEEAKSSQVQLELADDSSNFTDYVDTTKRIVTTLKSSVEKINSYFDEQFKMLTEDNAAVPAEEPSIKTEEEVVKVGTIKLVDLSKLIDPNRAKKVNNNNNQKRNSVSSDCAIVILSDSGSDVPPPKSKTRPKRNTRRDTDSDEIHSVISSRRNGIKNNSSTRFALRNRDKRTLAKVKDSDISISSDSEDDSRYKARGKRGRGKRVTFEMFDEKKAVASQDDIKFKQKCYVNLPKVPAERLKTDYMRKLELNEIKKLTNLKSLKRSRKSADGSDSSADSLKPPRKKSEKKERKKKEKKTVLSSSDSSKSDDDEPIAALVTTDKNKNDVPDMVNGNITRVGEGDCDNELHLDNIQGSDEDICNDSTDIEDHESTTKKKKSAEKDKAEAEDKNMDGSTKDKTNTEEDIENADKTQSDTTIPSDTTNPLDTTTPSDATTHSDTTTPSDTTIPKVSELIEKNNSDNVPKSNESDNSNLQEQKDADNDDTPTNGNKEPDDAKASEEKSEEEKVDDKDEGNISPEKDKKDDDKRKDDEKSSKKSVSDDKADETEKEDEEDDDDIKKKKKKEKDKSDNGNEESANEKKDSDGSDKEDEDDIKKKKQKSKEKEKAKADNGNEESSNEKKDSDGSDNETSAKKKNSNWKKDKLLTAAISSDSEGDKKRKEKSKKKKKEKKDNSSSDSDSEKIKEKSKKRKEKAHDSSDSESDKAKEKRKKRREKRDGSSDSESDTAKEKRKKRREKRDDSSSDSDIEKSREKFKKLKEKREKSSLKKKKRVLTDSEEEYKKSSSQAEESSSSDESVKEDKEDEKKKNRRRIKRVKDSSDDDEDKSTRKHIRRVWNKDSLAETTKQAEKNEQERKARIADRQKKYNNIFEEDKLEKSSLSKVVLDFNEETEEELLRVEEDIVKSLKPHQGKGVQFMWDACFESIDRAKNTEGSGCILAHCMGLGKTLQVITLVHTLLAQEEKTGVKKVLVVCPLSTVLNWVAEFKKWLPDDDVVEVFDLVAFKENRGRLVQMMEWHRCGGVLILGYDMFRNLSNEKNKRMPKKLRADFNTALVDPGPDLVVCDEGHLLKNEKTSLSICMNRLKTMRRIVLTGTPLQNNLKEYWCMVQFVKPNLLGTYKEYLNRFVNPITNGQYTDSTPHDIQIMRKRSHVLHKLLDGIVQRRDYSVLAPFLPPKYEYVLFISLTDTQVKLYQHYITHLARRATSSGKSSFLFIDFQELQRICTHPRVMLDKSIQQRIAQEKKDWENEDDESEGSLKDFIDDGSDDESSAKSTSSGSGGEDGSGEEKSKEAKKSKFRRRTRAMAENESDKEPEPVPEQEGRSEWWGQYTTGDELDNIVHSGKLHLLFEILHQCESMGDKVLVFSQSLYSLNVIEYFLAKIDEASQNGDSAMVGGYSGSWSLGLDYFRLDGSSSCDNRAAWCKTFNDPSNIRARLFLISTRAGGLGINLVAANRVVIFDVSWNPSHDIQSIYRVYRFGQTKPSYVYRFVTLGTMEMKIYERQVIKQSISKRVIDEQQIDRHYNQNDLAELYKFEPVPEEERPTPLVPKDILLGELLQSHDKLVYKYHEHQSLLENKEDEVLDEEERKAAWEEFENEKKARTFNYNTGVGANVKGLPMSTVISALKNIIKREHPIFTQREIDGVIPQLLQELTSQMNIGDMSMYQKVINEARIMQQRAQQMAQQQKMQEYYQMQQQWKLYQKFQQQMGTAGATQDPARFMQQMQQQQQQNQRQQGTSSRNSAANIDPLEVVRIDD